MNGRGDDQDDDIRRKAYELWEEEGRPEGKHDEHWRKAHERVRGTAPMPGADMQPPNERADEQDKAMLPENRADELTQTTEPEQTQAGPPASDEGTGEAEAEPAQKKVRTRRRTPAP